MNIVDWPAILHPQHSTIPHIVGRTASGGETITGIERVVGVDAGRWAYGFTVVMNTREKVRAWRGMIAKAKGRLGVIRVPFCDCGFDLASTSGARKLVGPIGDGVPHDDDAYHDDDMGYDQGYIYGTCTAAAGIEATSVTVNLPAGVVPEPGQHFSDGDRAYVISDVVSAGTNTWTLTFSPKLRAPIAAGKELSFDRIYCLMRLASEDLLAVDLELQRFATIRVDFKEAAW